jgi:hypothetical protein
VNALRREKRRGAVFSRISRIFKRLLAYLGAETPAW